MKFKMSWMQERNEKPIKRPKEPPTVPMIEFKSNIRTCSATRTLLLWIRVGSGPSEPTSPIRIELFEIGGLKSS